MLPSSFSPTNENRLKRTVNVLSRSKNTYQQEHLHPPPPLLVMCNRLTRRSIAPRSRSFAASNRSSSSSSSASSSLSGNPDVAGRSATSIVPTVPTLTSSQLTVLLATPKIDLEEECCDLSRVGDWREQVTEWLFSSLSSRIDNIVDTLFLPAQPSPAPVLRTVLLRLLELAEEATSQSCTSLLEIDVWRCCWWCCWCWWWAVNLSGENSWVSSTAEGDTTSGSEEELLSRSRFSPCPNAILGVRSGRWLSQLRETRNGNGRGSGWEDGGDRIAVKSNLAFAISTDKHRNIAVVHCCKTTGVSDGGGIRWLVSRARASTAYGSN